MAESHVTESSGEGWIVVGRLSRTRGRKGELIGEIDSDHPGRAEQLQEVLLKVGPRQATFPIEELWHHDGRPIFKFKGIDSISEAERWEGAEMLVPPEQRVQTDPGEYLNSDLIGCAVDTAKGRLGVVTDVEDYPGGPILIVTREAVGDTNAREVMVPFAKAICREVDIVSKVIRAELPEGLEDL